VCCSLTSRLLQAIAHCSSLQQLDIGYRLGRFPSILKSPLKKRLDFKGLFAKDPRYVFPIDSATLNITKHTRMTSTLGMTLVRANSSLCTKITFYEILMLGVVDRAGDVTPLFPFVQVVRVGKKVSDSRRGQFGRDE